MKVGSKNKSKSENRRRKRKEKKRKKECRCLKYRRRGKVKKRRRLEDSPGNALCDISIGAAAEGTESALNNLSGGTDGKVTRRRKKDVLQVTEMVAAALFAENVDDLKLNYLQDLEFPSNTFSLLGEAVRRLNTAYFGSAEMLKERRTEAYTTSLRPAEEEAERMSMRNQREAARIKERMMVEEVSKMRKITPVDKVPKRFYMLESEATTDDDTVDDTPQTVTRPPPPQEDIVFRTPVGFPPRRRVNNAGRPMRAAAILALQREHHQRVTRGGYDSSFSPTSDEEDFIADCTYEPATTDFGSDSN